MLGLSLFLGEGAGLERYGVAEKAGRFLCRASSSLAWKPHSLLLAHPRLTTPPPPTSRGAAVTSEAAGVAASLCCFFLSLFLSPHNKACAVRPVPGTASAPASGPEAALALGALPRAGSRPAPRARRSLPRRLRILSPSSSPRSRRSGRARRREGGASGEVPSWRSHWDPPPPPDSSAAARGGPETRAGQGAPPSP